MKRIFEMEKSEILALTSEQIETLVDYECATEGVPLLPIKPVKPNTFKPNPDITAYQVSGLWFKTSEEAAKVLAILQDCDIFKVEYVSGPSYEKRLVPVDSYGKPRIETANVFSIEHWDKVKNDYSAHESKMKQYEADKEEYDKAYNERSAIAESVWEVINKVRDEQYNKERITAEFERYLKLSDDNKTIAMRFLTKAHSVPTELAEELCPGFAG